MISLLTLLTLILIVLIIFHRSLLFKCVSTINLSMNILNKSIKDKGNTPKDILMLRNIIEQEGKQLVYYKTYV